MKVSIEIFEESPENPLEYSDVNLVAFHGRYTLGNQPQFKTPAEFAEYIDPMLKKDQAVVFPVYMMDHSGLTVKLGPFSGSHAAWDSGKIGYVYATKQALRDFYNVKRLMKKHINKYAEYVISILDQYTSYLNGWGYGAVITVTDDVGNEQEESISGYYDRDEAINDALAEAKRLV